MFILSYSDVEAVQCYSCSYVVNSLDVGIACVDAPWNLTAIDPVTQCNTSCYTLREHYAGDTGLNYIKFYGNQSLFKFNVISLYIYII